MLQTLDRAIIRKIREEIDEALATIGEKHGVSLKTTGGGTFTLQDANLRVRLSVLDKNGEAHDPAVDAFKLMATMFGFKPTDFGRVFTSNGKPFKIVGLKPSRPKYPILGARVPDGKLFKFPAADVLANLQ